MDRGLQRLSFRKGSSQTPTIYRQRDEAARQQPRDGHLLSSLPLAKCCRLYLRDRFRFTEQWRADAESSDYSTVGSTYEVDILATNGSRRQSPGRGATEQFHHHDTAAHPVGSVASLSQLYRIVGIPFFSVEHYSTFISTHGIKFGEYCTTDAASNTSTTAERVIPVNFALIDAQRCITILSSLHSTKQWHTLNRLNISAARHQLTTTSGYSMADATKVVSYPNVVARLHRHIYAGDWSPWFGVFCIQVIQPCAVDCREGLLRGMSE